MECERQRIQIEDTKKKMHEELVRRVTMKASLQEMERERERKVEQIQKMFSGDTEEGQSMADTNDKLSKVHSDLKKAFTIMEVTN